MYDYSIPPREDCHPRRKTGRKRLDDGVVLRKISALDHALCESLYIDARQASLQQAGWDAAQCLAYLQPRFARRERGIRHGYQQANDMIIQCDGVDCGRLLVDYRGADWRLIDIELSSEWRRRGIGNFILSRLCADAEEAGKPIAARVAFDNPLLSQLRRLGFEISEAGKVHLVMQRQPRS